MQPWQLNQQASQRAAQQQQLSQQMFNQQMQQQAALQRRRKSKRQNQYSYSPRRRSGFGRVLRNLFWLVFLAVVLYFVYILFLVHHFHF